MQCMVSKSFFPSFWVPHITNGHFEVSFVKSHQSHRMLAQKLLTLHPFLLKTVLNVKFELTAILVYLQNREVRLCLVRQSLFYLPRRETFAEVLLGLFHELSLRGRLGLFFSNGSLNFFGSASFALHHRLLKNNLLFFHLHLGALFLDRRLFRSWSDKFIYFGRTAPAPLCYWLVRRLRTFCLLEGNRLALFVFFERLVLFVKVVKHFFGMLNAISALPDGLRRAVVDVLHQILKAFYMETVLLLILLKRLSRMAYISSGSSFIDQQEISNMNRPPQFIILHLQQIQAKIELDRQIQSTKKGKILKNEYLSVKMNSTHIPQD